MAYVVTITSDRPMLTLAQGNGMSSRATFVLHTAKAYVRVMDRIEREAIILCAQVAAHVTFPNGAAVVWTNERRGRLRQSGPYRYRFTTLWCRMRGAIHRLVHI